MDKLQPATGFLVGCVLYCTRACAVEARHRTALATGRYLKPGEFASELYGAHCPNCGEEYWEF